jgi:UPF0271 protein
MGDDDALLGVVTSANVATGFHAGDPTTMRRTVAGAVSRDVAVGAHVSYPDLAGFGRRAMAVAPHELEADVLYQLGALDAMCRAAGTRVRHVKAHGALYHATLDDAAAAEAVCAAVVAFDASLAVVTMPGGALASVAAAAGLTVVREGYADRALGEDGRLVPRSRPGAVLHDPATAAAQAVQLVGSGAVDSICVHGDTPGAVAMARAVRDALVRAGFVVRAAAGGR